MSGFPLFYPLSLFHIKLIKFCVKNGLVLNSLRKTLNWDTCVWITPLSTFGTITVYLYSLSWTTEFFDLPVWKTEIILQIFKIIVKIWNYIHTYIHYIHTLENKDKNIFWKSRNFSIRICFDHCSMTSGSKAMCRKKVDAHWSIYRVFTV